MVWAGGDGSTPVGLRHPAGPLGTLNCGENVNTLARYALLADGERVHVANFPSCAPLGGHHTNTNDVYLPAAAHAYEGRLYNVVAQEFGTPEICAAIGVEFDPDAWNCISGTIGPDGSWIDSLQGRGRDRLLRLRSRARRSRAGCSTTSSATTTASTCSS